MFNDPRFDWWLQAFAYAAFAAVGGFMGHLMRTIDSDKKISWSRAIVEAVAAGFVGMLVLMACQAMGLSPEWKGVIVGVSGWLGASATIRMLELVVRKRLGIDSASAPEFNSPEQG